MIDAAIQRKNMVESQVRPSEISDRRVTGAMEEIPREVFVPLPMRPIAYADGEVRLKTAQPGESRRALMAPRTFAKLLQLADIGNHDVVLDVGCATGYSAAVLALIAETVVALEEDPELAETAVETTRKLSLDNLVVVTGELVSGYPSEGPFDAIILEGAVSYVPPILLDQLKDGGRLVAVLENGPVPRAVLWRRYGEQFDQTPAFEAACPRLPGFEAVKTFQF